jgi:hypothetical protein
MSTGLQDAKVPIHSHFDQRLLPTTSKCEGLKKKLTLQALRRLVDPVPARPRTLIACVYNAKSAQPGHDR